MGRKFTLKDMQKIARERKGKCLSKEYVNSHIKLIWKCSEGHIWVALPGSIKRGSWCPECARKKIKIHDMQRLAAQRGGYCVSQEYFHSHEKLKWRCSRGHEWEALPYAVKRGQWCPVCAGTVKLTIQKMRAAAQKRGGVCLSRQYVNSKTRLRWRCSKGHEWVAVPDKILRGQWCPLCAGRGRSIDSMHELAASRAGECLSEEYINARTKLTWKCQKGHIWEATPDKIRSGTWCPKCAGKNTGK